MLLLIHIDTSSHIPVDVGTQNNVGEPMNKEKKKKKDVKIVI